MLTAQEAMTVFKMLPLYKKQQILQRILEYRMERQLNRFVEPMPEWETEDFPSYKYDENCTKDMYRGVILLEDVINTHFA